MKTSRASLTIALSLAGNVSLAIIIAVTCSQRDDARRERDLAQANLAAAKAEASSSQVQALRCVDLVRKQNRFFEDLTGGKIPAGSMVACAVFPEPTPEPLLSRGSEPVQ